MGAAALLAASELAFRLVTLIGAAYICFLGVMLIVQSFRQETAAGPWASAATGPVWRGFLAGVWTSLLNPKVGVFYLATIPQFIPQGYWPLGMGLLLAAVHAALALVWFGLIIAGAGFARRWFEDARRLRVIDRVAGTILVGFGVRLALPTH